MIVLNEQLLGRNLEHSIAAWYHGEVTFITDLRPGTIIKDEAIPAILNRQRDALFLTINETDFWRRIGISRRFSVVCAALPDSHTAQIDPLLRRLLRHPQFNTVARRNGYVFRLTDEIAQFYSANTPPIHTIMGW